ncbi:MAG: prepilin-type N-terminal cleavage/methylation domain-containing protein [Deltaproteobacteria bacterium]|nr:prepilin-type N-terminal cleavage/methylation domain-containing protein [Deltaproteobacteria bacterium]
MTSPMLKGNKGFTLVEILVVIAIMGLVMASIYSVYLTNMKSAYTQEEVVEVQQNLRIAMDSITKDIRMAGMLVPTSTPPIASGFANYSSIIPLNMASARGIYARIDAAPTLGTSDTVTCIVESEEAVDVFTANPGNPVRIFRPVDCSQPFSTTYSVTATDQSAQSLTLRRDDSVNFAAGDVLKRGDMIAMTGPGAPDPNTVEYSAVDGGAVVNGVTCPQNQRCIVRNANGTADIIASNISSLRFAYIYDDYTETASPTDLGNVRAVRVTITGQTAETALLSGGSKTRQLTSIVKIHNRR